MTRSDLNVAMQSAGKLTAHAERCARRRQWRKADELFLQAVSMDPSPSSRIAYGVCLAEQERYFESISVFMPAMDGTDRKAIGIVCHNLAAIYREVGDFDLARRFQWQATLLQDESSVEDLLGLANDALMSDHCDAADSLVMAACEMTLDATHDVVDGDLLATTGLVTSRMESPEEGLMTLFSAYRRHQALSDFRRMGFDLLNMATVFEETGRYRAERRCIERAIRCFEQAAARHSSRQARQRLAEFDQIHAVRSFDPSRN